MNIIILLYLYVLIVAISVEFYICFSTTTIASSVRLGVTLVAGVHVCHMHMCQLVTL